MDCAVVCSARYPGHVSGRVRQECNCNLPKVAGRKRLSPTPVSGDGLMVAQVDENVAKKPRGPCLASQLYPCHAGGNRQAGASTRKVWC